MKPKVSLIDGIPIEVIRQKTEVTDVGLKISELDKSAERLMADGIDFSEVATTLRQEKCRTLCGRMNRRPDFRACVCDGQRTDAGSMGPGERSAPRETYVLERMRVS